MEFRYRIGDDRDPSHLVLRSSSSVSGGISGAPPLRGGFGGLVAGGAETARAADLMHRPLSASLALRRELQKQRIRDEIIAREMAEKERIRQEMIAAENERIRQEMVAAENERIQQQLIAAENERIRQDMIAAENERIQQQTIAQEMALRRELEEEVRREMAMEQAVEMERARQEVDMERALREADRAIGVRRAPFVEQPVLPPPEAMRTERLLLGTFQRHSEFGIRSELPPRVNPTGRARNETSIVRDDDVSEIDESLSAEEVKLFNRERPAIKRKGPVVAGTSKTPRIDKHRVPEEATYTYKPKGVTSSQQTGTKLTILVDGKPHQVMKKNSRALLCEVCGVTCYSTTVMATHLAGKKHTARVEELSSGAST